MMEAVIKLLEFYYLCIFCVIYVQREMYSVVNKRTTARWQFMRGTDPTKSNWVYPKLMCKIALGQKPLRGLFLGVIKVIFFILIYILI